ncbi:hypothetical protein CCMA1212_005058 [Trichoderma ghanense]|uniref:Uncharacterized protein n=1 Tax=Trichoderma ghanense TaxID=65468 RepID=A0ABY2H508_9HYPO
MPLSPPAAYMYLYQDERVAENQDEKGKHVLSGLDRYARTSSWSQCGLGMNGWQGDNARTSAKPGQLIQSRSKHVNVSGVRNGRALATPTKAGAPPAVSHAQVRRWPASRRSCLPLRLPVHLSRQAWKAFSGGRRFSMSRVLQVSVKTSRSLPSYRPRCSNEGDPAVVRSNAPPNVRRAEVTVSEWSRLVAGASLARTSRRTCWLWQRYARMYMYPALGGMSGLPCLFLYTPANELMVDSGRGHVLLRRVCPSTDALTGESHAETWYARGPIGLESRIRALVAWGAPSCESWPTGGPASERQTSMLDMVLITRHLFDAQFLGKLNQREMTPWALAAVDCIGVKNARGFRR